ncbi:flavodoxin family protein [Desulforhopalus singaporensis]|nr:flavodoxin family protein [Desulforhopalus singaporensis]
MAKRVLIIYYSFTQQTRLLVKRFSQGLEQQGVEVVAERLLPVAPYELPFRSVLRLVAVMARTFFRHRDRIEPLSDRCYESYDRIVIAGPTWSYNPSGPVLDFMDRYAEKICGNRDVTVIISARSYWRLNYFSMRKTLLKCGAKVTPPMVFEHPTKEPFRFVGLIMQLTGRMVRKESSWFRRHYPGYGHSREQFALAFEQGVEMGRKITAK